MRLFSRASAPLPPSSPTAQAWEEDQVIQTPEKPEEEAPQHPAINIGNLNALTQGAASLGREIVEIAGFLDAVDSNTQEQTRLLTDIQGQAPQIEQANTAASTAAASINSTAQETAGIIAGTVEFVRASSTRSRGVAAWVTELGDQVTDVMGALQASEKGLEEINLIAREVNILAVNASIEASRAGEAGKGFAIIASAIGELARKTAEVTKGMGDNVESLKDSLTEIASGSETYGKEATQVIEETDQTDKALADIASRATEMDTLSAEINTEAEAARNAAEQVLPNISKIQTDTHDTASEISAVRNRANNLIDRSETLVQLSVKLGGTSDDAPFIAKVLEDAAEIGRRMEEALASGRISDANLFSEHYQPIPGSNPEQVATPFTSLTDEICPQIQEAALEFSDRVVFCAAVDRNGYLPTHNKKFSQPQGADPVWNAANSRNRRIFDDRVGLKAGRNTAPFLLQVYRRDMGGGAFKMMKDLSAPIQVRGRHWGGLRLAYTF